MVKVEGVDLIPALSIYNGRPVVLDEKGEYDPLEDEDGAPLVPRDIVEELVNRFPVVFIFDINGIEENKPQYDVFQEITDLGRIWTDVGIRTADGLYDLFMTGVDLAVLGTKTIADEAQLEEAGEISDRVALGVDYDGKVVGSDPWIAEMSPRDLAVEARSYGIPTVFVLSLTKKNPVPDDVVRLVVREKLETYVGGGIGYKDAGRYNELGAKGILLDMRKVLEEGW